MNHCQPRCNDNCYQPVGDHGMCNLYNPAHYPSDYQYSHTVLQAPIPAVNHQWSTQYDAAVYRPCTNNTPPPEESLNVLLREQNDKYMPFTNSSTPLSPMSMLSVDTFDTPLSPNYHSSPSLHSTLYYAQNDDAYLQDYPQDPHQHQQQMQLQMQYELEHMQSPSTFTNEPMLSRYNQHQPYMSGFNFQVNVNTEEAPKRKRNSGKRTPASQLICPTCSRKFSRPYNLKSHQKTHTNERPYVCHHPGCSWTFARPHDLKRHDLLHSGIKKYICSCGKPFARSDAFKRHQAVDKVCSLRKV